MLNKVPLDQGWRQGALATRRPAQETEAKNILTKMDSKIEPKTKEKSYKSIKNTVDHIRYEFTNQDTIVFAKNGLFYKSYGNSDALLKLPKPVS